MTIWIDAQLSPSLALWINESFHGLNAKSVTALGLRDAKDLEIFNLGREQNAVIMSKDEDFVHLLDRFGPPPSILFITCGNTSNAKMKEVLKVNLLRAISLIKGGEPLVEITG